MLGLEIKRLMSLFLYKRINNIHTISGDIMNDYLKIVNKKSPKENIIRNSIVSFIVGGFIGVIGQGLIDMYMYLLDVKLKTAQTYMIITLIFIGCLLTCLGVFDKLSHKARCGLLIPILGFANSITSASLEYKKEGFVTGIGANMFKLAGTVIIYGVVSSYIFGILRVIIHGI